MHRFSGQDQVDRTPVQTKRYSDIRLPERWSVLRRSPVRDPAGVAQDPRERPDWHQQHHHRQVGVPELWCPIPVRSLRTARHIAGSVEEQPGLRMLVQFVLQEGGLWEHPVEPRLQQVVHQNVRRCRHFREHQCSKYRRGSIRNGKRK